VEGERCFMAAFISGFSTALRKREAMPYKPGIAGTCGWMLDCLKAKGYCAAPINQRQATLLPQKRALHAPF